MHITSSIRIIKSLPVILLMGFIFASFGAENLSAAHARGLETAKSLQANTSGLQGFHLISADQGWLLFNNRLYWSTDGGGSWRDITPAYATAATIAAVAFLDSSNGRVILTYSNGEDSLYALALTQDGGVSWQTAPLGLFNPGDINAFADAVYMQWLDTQVGWLVIKRATSSNFSLGTLFRTSDGGLTWKKLTLPVGEPVYFITSSVGWTAGGAAGNELYLTQDGGATWQAKAFVSSSGGSGQRHIYLLPKFEDVNNGLLPVMVTDGNYARVDFYRTGDGGQVWTLANSAVLDGNVDLSIRPPLAMIDTSHFVMVVPHSDRIVREAGPQPFDTRYNKDGRSQGIVDIDMFSLEVGWALSLSGDCTSQPWSTSNPDEEPKGDLSCTLRSQLLRTQDGGENWAPLALPGTGLTTLLEPFQTGRALTGIDSNISYSSRGRNSTDIFIGDGFDKCEISTLSQMLTWWMEGPYAAVNLYIGGSARACPNTLLSSSLLAQLYQQGWKFIPTWVGPQAPCTSFRSRMSYDLATAYDQGVNEANAALNAALGLGLTNPDQSNTIIYYDLEAYDASNTSCRNAVKSFMSGWTDQMLAWGNKSGVYGSPCSSALTDFLSIDTVPDGIWIARWSFSTYTSNVSVWGGSCLSDSNWANHQRIRQYTGSHNETWGGITFSIDSNVLDGILAIPYQGGSNVVAPVQPYGPKPVDGATLSRTNDTWLYWSTNGTSCNVHLWGGSSDINPSGNCSSLHLGPQKGGSYSWQVTARNNYGTTIGPVWTFNIRPYGPTGLTTTSVTDARINLSWTLSSDEPADIDGYDVYINNSYVATLPKGTSSTSVSGLSCNTTYSFFLRSNRQTVQSTNSNTVSAKTSPCLPGAFNKISPVNGAPAEPTSPTLLWGTSRNATSYQYCIDTTDDDTCDASWTSTDATSVTLSGLNPDTIYYWQVQALNADAVMPADDGAWWNFSPSDTPATVTASLTYTATPSPTSTSTSQTPVPTDTSTQTPTPTSTQTITPTATAVAGSLGPFNKLSPANGAMGITSSVTFSWGSSNGAKVYIYCFDTVNNNACDTYWTVTSSTSALVNGLIVGSTYYWQVQAINPPGAAFADNATWWSFSLFGNPATVTPGPSPTATSTPTVTSTPGPTKTPSPTAVTSPTPTPTPTQTRTLSPTSTTPPGYPGAFGKTNPANGTGGVPSSLTLSWGGSSGAALYIYCYDTLNNNNCDTFWTITYSTGVSISGLNPTATYYWQVEAVSAAGGTFADSGDWWSFSMSGTPPTVTTGPTPTPSPTRTSTVPGPVTTLTPSPSPTLTPTRTSTSPAPVTTLTPSPTSTPTSTATPFAPPSLTPTPSPTTAVVPPSPTTAAGYPGAFNKVSPANGAAGVPSSLTLSWGGSSGATLYIYCFDTVNNNNCDTFWTITYATSVSVNGLNYNATYYWQVEAVNAAGATFADGGSWWSFRMNP